MSRRKQYWCRCTAIDRYVKISVHARSRIVERLEAESWREAKPFVTNLILNAKPVASYINKGRTKALLGDEGALGCGDWILLTTADHAIIKTAFPVPEIHYQT